MYLILKNFVKIIETYQEDFGTTTVWVTSPALLFSFARKSFKDTVLPFPDFFPFFPVTILKIKKKY